MDSINIELLLKLFDQLEKASDRTNEEIQALGIVISNMIDILKTSTSNEAVIEHIETHDRKVEPTKSSIDYILKKCENYDSTTTKIYNDVSKLTKWVKNMILVVTIAFSIMSVTYLFTKQSIGNLVKEEVTHFQKSNVDTYDELDEIKRLIREHIGKEK